MAYDHRHGRMFEEHDRRVIAAMDRAEALRVLERQRAAEACGMMMIGRR